MRSNLSFKVGLIGNGSWATAIAKIMTDNHFRINWLFRKEEDIRHIRKYHHPPRYLTAIGFDLRKINCTTNIQTVLEKSDWVIICMPSAFLMETLDKLPENIFSNKFIVSGVKGMVPGYNLLLNDYLYQRFHVPMENYFCITGPCHAEEVAAEKLSYITISGQRKAGAALIAKRFTTDYLKTIVNDDIWGAQYAAVLKNIYAIGAGIAHGLGFGDNFLAVYVSNCAAELAHFSASISEKQNHPYPFRNAFASAYLGDLLVTCYSQYSRNRTFGTMIGKGYSVSSAKLEMNMIAEGYPASKGINEVNKELKINAPIADIIFQILWRDLSPVLAFNKLKRSFR